jgi:hypothetical protein
VAQNAFYSFTPTASDADNDVLTFSITNQPSWANFNRNSGTLSGTPTNDHVGTTNNIVISVSDGAMTSSLAAFNLTVTNVNDPPTIGGSPSTFVGANVLYSFTPTAQDIDGDMLTFSIVNLPSWANFDSTTGRLSGTPSESDVGISTNNIVITASDGVLSASLPPFGITVNTLSAAAGFVNLTWPSSLETNIAGYVVVYGNTPNTLHNFRIVNASTNPSFVASASDLGITTSGIYYFAVQAYTDDGQFSGISSPLAIDLTL